MWLFFNAGGVAAAPPANMVVLSLKICVRHCNVVKTMQFEPSTAVYDACRIIRERVPEAQTGQGENAGTVLSLRMRQKYWDTVPFHISRVKMKSDEVMISYLCFH